MGSVDFEYGSRVLRMLAQAVWLRCRFLWCSLEQPRLQSRDECRGRKDRCRGAQAAAGGGDLQQGGALEIGACPNSDISDLVRNFLTQSSTPRSQKEGLTEFGSARVFQDLKYLLQSQRKLVLSCKPRCHLRCLTMGLLLALLRS